MKKRRMRIGVDMDGQFPERIVEGVRSFDKERSDVNFVLCGRRESMDAFDRKVPSNSEIWCAADSVGRRDRGSSLNKLGIAMGDGVIDGFFTVGNTTDVMFGLSRIGRLKIVSSPTLVAKAPTENGGEFFVSDAGASVKRDSGIIYEQMIMASTYVGKVLGRIPRVGLLSNGEEEEKGDDLCREIDAMIYRGVRGCGLDSFISYVGKVESDDCFNRGMVDILVGRGYEVNFVLKAAEAVLRASKGIAVRKFYELPFWDRLLAGRTVRKLGRMVYGEVNPDEYNGGVVLGYKRGVVVKGHGNSREGGIHHGLLRLVEAVNGGVGESLNIEIVKNLERYSSKD